ncbi:hypothetical protein [Hydrogenophaga sp. PAMC20947]|uniref:hypothetical protein n=1 Tax=Hydrogenophaga sp. PAMC20947 TaxID=2565558 RepID=UPI00109DBE23|nr:hypothetical protein [Hydrogenophaga sp. PAMC20947]QCB44819.1 hypothetical protein E5678_01445 [Hydrogenophaga sp. PAMC20947]
MRWMPSMIAWAMTAILSACSVTGPAAPVRAPGAQPPRALDSDPATAVQGSLVDPACAGEPVSYEVRPFDLGDTNRPARAVVLSGSPCLGATGQLTELWVQIKGEWVSQLKTAGTLVALPMQRQGYAHLTVQGLGPCAPIWRWEGSGYRAARTCP